MGTTYIECLRGGREAMQSPVNSVTPSRILRLISPWGHPWSRCPASAPLLSDVRQSSLWRSLWTSLIPHTRGHMSLPFITVDLQFKTVRTARIDWRHPLFVSPSWRHERQNRRRDRNDEDDGIWLLWHHQGLLCTVVVWPHGGAVGHSLSHNASMHEIALVIICSWSFLIGVHSKHIGFPIEPEMPDIFSLLFLLFILLLFIKLEVFALIA